MNIEKKFFKDFLSLQSEIVRRFSILERDEIAYFGVSPSQCYTLEALLNKDKLSMKDLSREIGVAVSTMTRILNVMIRENLVTREPGNQNRRKIYISLSPKGKELAVKLKQCAENYLLTIYSKIPSGKKKEVVNALSVLLKAMSIDQSCCIESLK